MLSQYTRPGVAVSIAQQEAFYREPIHAQLQQFVSDRRADQAHSPSGIGMMSPANQASTDVQNVTLPPLQPPLQPPGPLIHVMASSHFDTFVSIFSTFPQANQTMAQPAL